MYRQLPIALPTLDGLITPTIDDDAILTGIEVLLNCDYLKNLKDKDLFYGLDVCMYVIYALRSLDELSDRQRDPILNDCLHYQMLNELRTICKEKEIKKVKDLLYENTNYPNFKYFATLLELD